MAILTSCNTEKNDVEKYIRDNAQYVETLDIMEVSKKDSMYSPFAQVISATMVSFDLTKKSEYNEDYANRVEYIVPDSLVDTYNLVDSIHMEAMLFIDLGTHLTREPNRAGVEATYRLNGALKKEIFFYNLDGVAIGHTKTDVYNNFKQLDEVFSTLVINR